MAEVPRFSENILCFSIDTNIHLFNSDSFLYLRDLRCATPVTESRCYFSQTDRFLQGFCMAAKYMECSALLTEYMYNIKPRLFSFYFCRGIHFFAKSKDLSVDTSLHYSQEPFPFEFANKSCTRSGIRPQNLMYFLGFSRVVALFSCTQFLRKLAPTLCT